MSKSKKKKWEEFNLDAALSAAESGDVGRMLKDAAEQIEPRAEFAHQLEARLQDETPAYAKNMLADRPPHEATTQSEPLAAKWWRSLEQTFSGQARGTSIRAVRFALGLVGVAGMIVILVGMAQMLRMRQEVSRGNGTPTVLAGGAVDSQALADSFELLHTIKPEPIEGFHGQPLLMKWSPDGQILATGAGTSVELWERSTGQSIAKFDTPIVRSMEWSPGGAILAVGTGENKVFLVDPQTVSIRSTLAGPFEASWSLLAWYANVTGLAWSPDGSMIASMADEAASAPTPQPEVPSPGERGPYMPDRPIPTIRLWDVSTGRELHSITVPSVFDGSRYTYNLSWSPNGGTLISYHMFGPIRLWDPKTGQQQHQINVDKNNGIEDIQWSPDGQILSVVTGRVVQLWDVKSGRLRHTLPESKSLPTMPPPPKPIATRHVPQPVPSVPGSPLPTHPPVSPYVQPTPAPDGYYYVSTVHWSADAKTLSVVDWNHIRRWDATTGSLIGTTFTSTYWTTWSPDGRMLATWYEGIKLGDPLTGNLLRKLTPYVTSDLAWSHDAHTLAIGKISENREAQLKSIEVEIWGSNSAPIQVPEPTSTVDTRTSLPVPTAASTETQVAVPPTEVSTTTVESTATRENTSTSTIGTSPTPSPDPKGVCSGWSVVDSPSVDTVNELQAVAAVSSDDVWAVGYSSTDDSGYRDGMPVPGIEHTLIMHWDGAKWSIVSSPNPGKVANRLLGVSAISKNDVWAVGYYSDDAGPNQPLTESQTLTLHWDGQAWNIVLSPDGKGATMSRLSSVAALARDNVWAVGTYGSYRNSNEPAQTPIESSRTLIVHWDGKSWSQIESPNPGTIANRLSAIAAVSGNDIWAVGSYTEFVSEYNYTMNRPLFMHWNGEAWSNVAGPDLKGYIVDLASISALQSDDIWVAGYYNGSGDPHGSTLVLNWDGKSWQEVPGSRVEVGTGSGFQAVAAIAADDIWMAYGYWPAALQRWQGQNSSTFFPNGLDNPTDAGINGLAALSTNDIWGVGILGQPGRERKTLAIHYSGPGCVTPGTNP